MSNVVDFSQLSKVKQSNFKSSSASDLKFKAKTGRFAISTYAFEKLGLSNKGLTLMVHQELNKPFLAVEPEDQAVFMKKKKGAESKGREFKNDALLRSLTDSGMIDKASKEDKEFNLEHAGDDDNDDVSIYQIVAVGEPKEFVEEQSERIEQNETSNFNPSVNGQEEVGPENYSL